MQKNQNRAESCLLATLLLAAVAPTWSQSTTPPSPTPVAAPESAPSEASSTAAPTPATPKAAEGSGSGKASKAPAVCFKLTGHCVEGGKPKAHTGSATGAPGSAPAATTAAGKPLNLTAPDVRTVVPAAELKEPLPSEEQITETQESETVQVRGDTAAPPPDVPGGFGAIWWALSHPSQSWRIVTPAE